MGSEEGFEETIRFQVEKKEEVVIKEILTQVYRALQEKGYDPVSQLIGYFLSGDPAYITTWGNARNLIRKVERDRILEGVLRSYLGIS